MVVAISVVLAGSGQSVISDFENCTISVQSMKMLFITVSLLSPIKVSSPILPRMLVDLNIMLLIEIFQSWGKLGKRKMCSPTQNSSFSSHMHCPHGTAWLTPAKKKNTAKMNISIAITCLCGCLKSE